MPCPECPETPDTGCLQPITTECVTYNGNDIDCADISSGQSLNQVIEQLANNDCGLQEQIEDIVQDIEELSGSVQTQINNIPIFSCEDLSGCSLDNLLDVDVSPASGDNLVFNGEKWVNYTPEEVVPYQFTCEELSGCTLDELSGVVITDPASGDVIYHNGTVFSNYPLSTLISVDASNGLTELSGNVKLGGTLIENTEVDFDDSFDLTFNNLGRFGVFSGSATYAPKTFFQSEHNLTNPTPTLGYQTNILGTNVTLSSYSLTNGKAIINSLFKNTFTLGSDLTITTGSQVSNSFNYQSFNATGSSRNFTVDQSDKRVLGNNKIVTELSFTDYKTTLSHYANQEIINNVSDNTKINTFTNFYQLLIREAYGTGLFTATSANIVNTYGIYQEGAADKNVYYGESIFYGAVKNSTGVLQFTSDKRVKENIEDYTNGLSEIDKIEVKNFNFKWNKSKKVIGVIAQDLEDISPNAVETGNFTTPDGVNYDDFKMVDQNVIFYTMLNSIKELSAKNKELESRIIALENK